MKKLVFISFMISILTSCVTSVNVTPNSSNPSTTPSSNGTNNNTSNNSGTVGTDPIATGSNLEVKAPTTLKSEDFKLEVSSTDTKITLDKFTFKPEEDIKIKLSVPESYYSNDSWIGVFLAKSPGGDAKTNDANDINYVYVSNVKGMEFATIKAPVSAGVYEIRLSDGTEEKNKEISRLKFIVSNSDGITDSKLKLAKNTFKKGEKIALEYESALEIVDLQPWIGVIPSNIPHVDASLNDQNDIDYKYIDGKNKGTLIFDSTNYSAGKYDFRLNDSDKGKEVIYISFEITE
jgi:hypothetical protein